jgi:type I restriction enzyme M protein
MDTLFEIQLSKEDNLLKRFEEIHDYIYANDGLSPQQTLEEFVKVLFIKIVDENESQKNFTISSNEWNEIKSGKSSFSFSDRISNLFKKTQKKYPECLLLTNPNPFLYGLRQSTTNKRQIFQDVPLLCFSSK